MNNMSYLALYRRFRPTDFNSVFGQDHITKTLKNQIQSGKIGHAYLFTGTRGTGKTSVAKIFARAVNCENALNGNPCGKCPTCLALKNNEGVDVIEMDAASNNGVDDLRDLKEKVVLQPTIARYKVYIIDEVHMLTTSAFNALLKTLEEPPKHVIFILATTEVQKIPATILSRCMRFDFRLVPTDLLFENLKRIYTEVGKEAEDEALYAIAKSGEGSVRDSLSVADMCLSATKGKLTYEDVSKVLGNLSDEGLFEMYEHLLKGEADQVLDCVEDYVNTGKNIPIIARDIAKLFRNLLIAKLSGTKTLNYPQEKLVKVKELASLSEESFLLRGLDIFSELDTKFKGSSNQRILLESALLKMTSVNADLSLLALNRRLTALEKGINGGNVSANFNANTVEDKKKEYNVAEQPTKESGTEAIKAEVKDSAVKGKLLSKLRISGNLMLHSAISRVEVEANGDKLVLIATPETKRFLSSRENREDLSIAIGEIGYKTYDLVEKSKQSMEEEQKIINNATALSGGMLKVKE
ncbi:MAG: DNA polymerase III subunit gamma/tau [Clostridia bacterium]|nr:DNA polymerase III subunit gamma/tau [Clostridia bacterium]